MQGIRIVAALVVAALVLVASASESQAQLLRRGRGNCNSGCGGGGCNVGSQGCNISQSATPTRATAEDLLEQVSATKQPASRPVLPSKEKPLTLDPQAALAFCQPVETSKHALDLRKVVYRKSPPLQAVASR